MNSQFKAIIKASGNNHLTNYILTSYNESQTLFPEILNTRDERRAMINMQNKANLLKSKMNLRLIATRDYENKTAFRLRKNKPNQTQSVFCPPSSVLCLLSSVLCSRMKHKMLNLLFKNSLTAGLNSLKCFISSSG